MLRRWTSEGFAVLGSEGTPECSEILHLMEGLHVTTQASRLRSPVAILLASFNERVKKVEENGENKNEDDGMVQGKSDTVKFTLHAEIKDDLSGRVSIPKRKSHSRDGSEEDSIKYGSDEQFKEEEEEEGLKRRRRSSTLRAFDANALCSLVKKNLSHFHISDLMGFDPSTRQLPLAPHKYNMEQLSPLTCFLSFFLELILSFVDIAVIAVGRTIFTRRRYARLASRYLRVK